MKKSFLVFVALLLSFLIAKPALADNPRKVCVTIKTSAECEFCKAAIEKSLPKAKGVRKVKVDFVKHEVYVTYNSKKTSIEQIRKELNAMGYDADGQKANFDKFKSPVHDKL
ncbi:MAG: hypothetical protein K0S33_1609 [Bacteroidetes bacterium]|jgi:copper chaperone CopZ|nr:hypothetical protein [Bacteroidota bacterium]